MRRIYLEMGYLLRQALGIVVGAVYGRPGRQDCAGRTENRRFRHHATDEMPGSETRWPQSLGGTTSGVFLYVKDVDAVFHKATTARAKAAAQPADMFWGDRYAKVMDPYGHSWSLATPKEDVAPAEPKKRPKPI